MRKVLISAAVAFLLLIGSGLLLASFARLSSVPLGFQADHVLTVRLSLPVILGPTGLAGVMSPDGERTTARAAATRCSSDGSLSPGSARTGHHRDADRPGIAAHRLARLRLEVRVVDQHDKQLALDVLAFEIVPLEFRRLHAVAGEHDRRVLERDLILETLKHCLGNRTHAANILGISIRTLRNKLNEYSADGVPVPPPGNGVDTNQFRPALPDERERIRRELPEIADVIVHTEP